MQEESAFLQVFGESPIVKVLDFLITFREFDYSLTSIASESGVGWTTLHSFWPRLEKLGLVKHTRNIGRAKLYKLNMQNPAVREIIRLDEKLCSHFADAAAAKSTAKTKQLAVT